MASEGISVGVKGRPVSTTSSQLSISDRMTDGEEDNISLRSNLLAQASSSCSSSLNLQRQSNIGARTTTISTIAMESNTAPPGSKVSPTRLVIALLQTPHKGLQLKVIELNPALLKLPDNFIDAEDYLKNHNQVIKNLQSKQSPVEELLRQADNLIATQRPRAEVYAAMADSLGQTWKDLNGILEERRNVIQLAYNAHKNISECLKKMDELQRNAEYSKMNYLGSGTGALESLLAPNPSPMESLRKLKEDRADILKSLSQCLESCDQLLNKIAEYNYTVDSRELVLVRDVEFANRQVNRWLERLHDRRIILEDRLKNKREQLEEFDENSKFQNEFKYFEEEGQKFKELFKEFNLGDSVASAEARRDNLKQLIYQLKMLQEKELLAAKRLEDVEGKRAKFCQRSGLKSRIFEILASTNDLLREALDFEGSLIDAKEFFILADNAVEKLDVFSSQVESSIEAKNELNKLTEDAINKGKLLLDLYGWDSNTAKGVRYMHDNLIKKKNMLLEQLQHLDVLNEYNDFLDNVNQTYQNILNLETSRIRIPIVMPINLPSTQIFKTAQENSLEQVSNSLGLDPLMNKLQDIYPELSEDEKVATEKKINELKSLSNQIVELLMQRIDLTLEWIKILEIYGNTQIIHDKDMEQAIGDILKIRNSIRGLLPEIHESDVDLITLQMEEEIERIVEELQRKQKSSADNQRIREICQKYKIKLDHHLLGDPVTQSPPQFYPVLGGKEVISSLILREDDNDLKSNIKGLQHVLHRIVKPKLESVLTSFFQPLITSFRQELLDVQCAEGGLRIDKSPEELDFERYCDRLKESYVKVSKEIETFVVKVTNIFDQVIIRKEQINNSNNYSLEQLQKLLQDISSDRQDIQVKIQSDICKSFEQLLLTIQHEEPPLEGDEEKKRCHLLLDQLKGIDEVMANALEDLMNQIRDERIMADLLLIDTQLQKLINELNFPTSYGNNLEDAQLNKEYFVRFEETIELLYEKLLKMLSTAGIPQTYGQPKSVRDKMDELKIKRQHRLELINLSLEYFTLIEESEAHYKSVGAKLENVQKEAYLPEMFDGKIEELLHQLLQIKDKEYEQERRLEEIERISKIIFDNSVSREREKHQPLRMENSKVIIKLQRLEADLNDLLKLIRKRIDPIIKVAEVEAPLEQMKIAEEAMAENRRSISSNEMFTQTSAEELGNGPNMSSFIEIQTSSMMTTSQRQAYSPLPPITLEKETQFECNEEIIIPEKIDRDTITQTVDERISSIETQTENVKLFSTATETEDEMEIQMSPIRPLSGDYQNPTFVQPLKDILVNEGEPVFLDCRTSGLVKTVVWFKDGMEITNNPDYRIESVAVDSTTSGHKLHMEEAFSMDSAIFTCRATGGEKGDMVIETSGRLTVKEPSKSLLQPPCFLSHPPISRGVHGHAHMIQLEVEGNPLPTVQWFHNGQCIDTSPDYIITFNNGKCNINFDEVLKELDEGIYTCMASNKLGDAETHVELQVQHDDAGIKKRVKQKPRILTPLPKNLMCRAGQPLELRCDFESPSECNIIWWQDDKALTITNSACEFGTFRNYATLSLREMYPSDSGKYRVLVRNAAGECQSECSVTVKGLLPADTSDSEMNVSDIETIKPTVKMHLQDADGSVGDSLQLDCVIVGHPEPEVIWYKNDCPLKESSNLRLIFQGDRCSLIIKQFTELDKGKYSVIAVNNAGETTSKCQIGTKNAKTLPAEEKPEPPVFAKTFPDQMITAGEDVKFEMELSTESLETVQVTWWKGNKKLETSDRIELLNVGNCFSLLIKDSKLQDKGNYMAKATNAGGDAKCFACLIVKESLEKSSSGSEQFELVSNTPQKEQPRRSSLTKVNPKPPRIVVPLEGRMVDEGDQNVTLRCVIDANPPAELKWTKNNSSEPIVFNENPNLHQVFNERNGEIELVIKRVTAADGGRYSLSASNTLGNASTVADVIVKKTTFPPVFSKRLQSLSIEEGKRLHLEVDVFGKPQPQVIWQLNGETIRDETFILQSDSPTRHSLSVKEVILNKHAGEYTAIARNDVGEASASCSITVIGSAPPPVPPKPKMNQVNNVETLIPKLDEPIIRKTVIQEEISMSRQITSTCLSTIPTNETSQIPTVAQDEILLEPGPKPEILVADSPHFKTSKNQVLEKVKTFEERAETPDNSTPPSGGIRIIPIKEHEGIKLPAEKIKPVNVNEGADLQILTPLQPSVSPISFNPTNIPPVAHSPFQIPSHEEFHAPSEERDSPSWIEQTQRQTLKSYSEVSYIKPSKFIPEKMRESDYESDFETTPIPPKWKPKSNPNPSMQTTSAFVPATTAQIAFIPSPSIVVAPGNSSAQPEQQHQKPAVTKISQPAAYQQKPTEQGVKGMIKSWPPQNVEDVIVQKPVFEAKPTQFLGVSPSNRMPSTSPSLLHVQGVERSRSPTPNREALEMDKLWSKPIRFSSPSKLSTSPVSSPLPRLLSPSLVPNRLKTPDQKKPEVPPKPGKAYTPTSSPLPPVHSVHEIPIQQLNQPYAQAHTHRPSVPPKPYYLSPMSPPPIHESESRSPRDPFYYVSVVSTPRTTPVPTAFSPSPDSSFAELSNFEERREFFEQTSSSYSTMEETTNSSSYRQSSTSKSILKKSSGSFPSDSGISLLDQSLLPPRGESPEFLYAPPPLKKSSPNFGAGGKSPEPKIGGANVETEFEQVSESPRSSTTPSKHPFRK